MVRLYLFVCFVFQPSEDLILRFLSRAERDATRNINSPFLHNSHSQILAVFGNEGFKEAAKVGATTSGALGFAQSSFASAQSEEVVSNLAGIDGRIAIFFVFAPVLGWVAYNILGPGLKQLDDMQVKNAKRYRWWGDWERFGTSLMMQLELERVRNKSSGTASIDGRIAIFFVFRSSVGSRTTS